MSSARNRHLATGALIAVAAVAAVTVAIYGLREIMPVTSAGVLYLLPVLLASTYWGLWMGAGTAVLSALAFNFFHLPPTGRFTIADEQNWVALAVFVVAAVVTSTLAGAARSRADEADRRRREADLAAEMARTLLGSGEPADSLPVVGQRIAQAFGLPWVEVELGWIDSDQRRRALPVVIEGSRAATLAVPRDTDQEIVEVLERRIVPGLETLLTAARRREGLEAQVIETQALRRANVVKTALLRSVSHDLRSPLTAITASAGGLSSPTLTEEQRAELVEVITSEAARLTKLVDDLLDLSRLQAGQLEPQAGAHAVRELVETAVTPRLGVAGGVDVIYEEEPGAVNVDAAQVERALANVLDNSLRYAGEMPVIVNVDTIGGDAMIRVSDRGPGIPSAELDRIFEPFHTAEGDGSGGSGLGLAIARGFVEANGGSLRAQSLPGQGATFTIRLPMVGA
jgi:two-component system sensor histidine kinase KdpD